MAKCGFGRVVVNGVFEPKCPFVTDLEGRFVYVREADRQWLLAAFDFSYMFRRTSLAWRQAISHATGIPLSDIWVHELQNHTAPVALDLEGEAREKLVKLCLPEIQRVIAEADDAELSYALVDLGNRYNMNREQYIPGLGMVTVWHGFEFDENDRPHCGNPWWMLLQGYTPDLPAFKERIYFDRPADPQGALLVFRNRQGRILGTIARFAAHADIVDSCCYDIGNGNEKVYHFDWPGYMRQALDTKIGGTCVCLCGPCGNLTTKKRRIAGCAAGDRQAREISSAVVDELLSAWNAGKKPWQALQLRKSANTRVDLPLRTTVPASHEELAAYEDQTKHAEAAFLRAKEDGTPAYRVKQLGDEHLHKSCMPQIVDRWVGLSDEELQNRLMTVELEAVGLNDLVFAGLPGESMADASLWLRAQSIGQNLITVDQVNGYCAYQTTREQYDLGGYAFWCSCLARDSESITRREALKLIRNVSV